MGNNAIKIDHVFAVHKEPLKTALKPRTVSLEGGEDDAITLGNIVVSPLVLNKIPSKRDSDSEENTSKYIVPALRQRKVLHSTNQRSILGSMPCSRNIQGNQKQDILFRGPSIGEMPIELIPSDEVEPCFRTPCNYLYNSNQESKLT